MYKIMIVDDNIKDLERLKKGIENDLNQLQYSFQIDTYQSINDIKNKTEYQIAFLDIDMPDVSGFDFAGELKDTYIIFVTNRDDLVFKSFEYNPFAFIRKYLLSKELTSVLERLMKQIQSQKQYLKLQFKNKPIYIQLNDVLYIESYLHYCHIYTRNEKITVRYKLSTLNHMIQLPHFCQVHQSFIVNFQHVIKLDRNHCYLKNELIIPISQRKYKDTLISYQKYIMKGV